jgi:hypothetical protein
MFHTAEEVEINLSWQNTGDGAIHVAHQPQGGTSTWVTVMGKKTSQGVGIELPESKIVFTFGEVAPLSLVWELVDGSGQFNLDGESQGWVQDENLFTIGANHVNFRYAESGITIVGILDIGGL